MYRSSHDRPCRHARPSPVRRVARSDAVLVVHGDHSLLSADVDAVCGAEYGIASPDRVNSRNGYRHRELDTRTGTIDVAIPKLRPGSCFPEWLLERRAPRPR